MMIIMMMMWHDEAWDYVHVWGFFFFNCSWYLRSWLEYCNATFVLKDIIRWRFKDTRTHNNAYWATPSILRSLIKFTVTHFRHISFWIFWKPLVIPCVFACLFNNTLWFLAWTLHRLCRLRFAWTLPVNLNYDYGSCISVLSACNFVPYWCNINEFWSSPIKLIVCESFVQFFPCIDGIDTLMNTTPWKTN